MFRTLLHRVQKQIFFQLIDSVAKVRVTLDMWEEIKNKKKVYVCPFTLWIDGRSYTQAQVSVFNPEDLFDKIKNELSPYFENFLN